MKRLIISGLLLLLWASTWARTTPILQNPAIEASPTLSTAPLGTSFAVGETTFFGGTGWAPDSMRWEAIEDSVWTFDSGVGSFLKEPGRIYPGVDPFKADGLHGGMEGWTGKDNTYSEMSFFRRLGASDPRWNGSPCVGISAALGGAYSFWAGVFPVEADSLCFLSGKGYGNNWNVCIEHIFSYEGGSAHLSYQFRNETEEGFDSTHVYCDTSSVGDRVQITAYTGNAGGVAQFDLTPGIELPVVPKPIKLQFCVHSDGAWSDQDGLGPTSCGAFAIDNISLTGGISYTCDFESDAGGWFLSPPSAGPGGEWSNLAYLGDLSLPDSLTGSCTIRDSVLVFYDPARETHPLLQDNVVMSPWIDLERFGAGDRDGYAIQLGGYFDLPLLNYILLQFEAQWFPDTCRVSGTVNVSPWTNSGLFFFFGPGQGCRKTYTFDVARIIPPRVEEVRVAVGVINYCRFFENCARLTNSSPWLDNVRLAAYKVVFDTIQEAIDAAAPGDTVWIPPGTYTGSGDANLTFRGKNIVLKSMAGAANTIIDGSNAYRGFISDQGEDSTAAVIGFTFQDCWAIEQNDLVNGGAVYVGSGSSIRFEDCVFLTSRASSGGAVFVASEGEPTFRRCTFSQNRAGWGGAIAASGGVFESCLISGNHADSGGGLWVYRSKLSGCRIQGNTASLGGGIYGYYSDFARFGMVEMHDCLVAGNAANIRGGGLDLHNLIRMSGTTVAGNHAELAGGMYTRYGGTVHRSIFWDNAADSSGADVFLSARMTFTCSAVNPSGIGGGSLAAFDGPQVFTDPLFCQPDYTLAINSPCLPFASPCDSLIGALGEGCGVVSVIPPPVPDETPFLKAPGIHTGPNPFTQALTIHYLSPFGTDPKLEIYSVDGRLIGKWSLRPGSGVVNWDGRDPVGRPVASGIYLVRYTAGDLRVVRRVVRIAQ